MISETLLIRLLDNEQVEWVFCTKQGNLFASPNRGALSDVPSEQAANCHIVVLLPSLQISLHALKLPSNNRKQQIQAIPFALENDLISDVEDYFFAMSHQRNEDGTLPVAVIKRDYLEHCLAELKRAGLSPNVMLPDVLALAVEKNSYSVFVEDNVALVRTGELSGFAVDAGNLETILSEHGSRHQINKVENDQSSNDFYVLEQAAQRCLSKPPINLLQGEFRVKKSREVTPWYLSLKTSIVLFVVLILVCLLTKGARYASLASVVHTQHREITQLYRNTFPGTSLPADPKAAMSERLAQLRIGAAGDPALQMLAKLGDVMQAYPSLTVRSIKYDDQVLTVVLPLVNLQWQRKLVSQLQAEGLSVNDSYRDGVLVLDIKDAQ